MKTCFLIAGGTGGHINAAIALGEHFEKLGFKPIFISGKRELDFKLLKNKAPYHMDAWPLRSNNPIQQLKSFVLNFKVFIQTFFLIFKHKPKFLLGAGGYICGPTLLAGKCLGKPIYILEQNAVMGVTNRIVSYFATKIFVNFKDTRGIGAKFQNKKFAVGNPIRSSVKECKNIISDEIKILIFGGSLGADQINNAIPFLLQKHFSKPVSIKHQVGLGKKFHVNLPQSGIRYEQIEYIDDIQSFFDWSNIIISRAGASSISELRIVKRPSILIPFPGATDNHQELNALQLKNEKLFHVDILDQKLKGESLAQAMGQAIEKIIENSHFSAATEAIIPKPEDKIWDIVRHDFT